MHSKENLRLTRKNTIQAATRTPISLSPPNLARLWKRGSLGICHRHEALEGLGVRCPLHDSYVAYGRFFI